MTLSTSGAGIAGTRSSALVVRDGVFEVGFSRVAGAGRERTVPVADLDQVAEGVVGLVGVRLVGVVAREGGHRFQAQGELEAAGDRERPDAVTARRAGVVCARGEVP